MRPDPDAKSTPSRLETPEPQEELTALDTSPLARFDPSSVLAEQRKIHGFVTISAGHQPLEATVGQSCGDPFCRFRSIELRLHGSIGALMSNFRLASEAQGLSGGAFIGEFNRDIFLVSSGALTLATADLRQHPILHKIRLSLDRLHDSDADAPEWQLVRAVRSGLSAEVIELPLDRPFRGRELLVSREVAERLCFTRQGPMDELIPILNTDAREELALSWRMRGLFRRKGE